MNKHELLDVLGRFCKDKGYSSAAFVLMSDAAAVYLGAKETCDIIQVVTNAVVFSTMQTDGFVGMRKPPSDIPWIEYPYYGIQACYDDRLWNTPAMSAGLYMAVDPRGLRHFFNRRKAPGDAEIVAKLQRMTR